MDWVEPVVATELNRRCYCICVFGFNITPYIHSCTFFTWMHGIRWETALITQRHKCTPRHSIIQHVTLCCRDICFQVSVHTPRMGSCSTLAANYTLERTGYFTWIFPQCPQTALQLVPHESAFILCQGGLRCHFNAFPDAG